MVKADRILAAALRRFLIGVGHAGLLRQHRRYPPGAGQGFGQGDDQGGQLDQLHNDLEHVVVQRHHVALGNIADVHLHCRPVDEEHRRNVDEHIGQRIQQRGDPSHKLIEPGEGLIALVELLHGLPLPAERPDDPYAGEIFPGQAGHPVKGRLGFFEQGDAH